MHGSSLRLGVLLLGVLTLSLLAKFVLYKNEVQPLQKYYLQVTGAKLLQAQALARPAVFLGGGSNVLSGLRADVMQDILKRPVINLGVIDEASDYRNSMALLEASAQPGDTVVYSSRGFHMIAPFQADALEMNLNGLALHLNLTRDSFNMPDRAMLLSMLPSTDFTHNAWELAENFDTYGDFKLCLGRPGVLPAQPFLVHVPGQPGFLATVADFSARLTAKGIKVYLLLPNLLVNPDELPRWEARARRVVDQLSTAGAQWAPPPVGGPFLTDRDAFCETPLHPSTKRAIMNSQMLATQLAERI